MYGRHEKQQSRFDVQISKLESDYDKINDQQVENLKGYNSTTGDEKRIRKSSKRISE